MDCSNTINLKSNPLFILQNFHSCEPVEIHLNLVCPCIYFVYHRTLISSLLNADYKGSPYFHMALKSLLMEKLTTVPHYWE